MTFQPWMLVAMEEIGHMSADERLINRVQGCSNDAIRTYEFCRAYYACDKKNVPHLLEYAEKRRIWAAHLNISESFVKTLYRFTVDML